MVAAFLADKRDLCHNEIISFCLRKETKRMAADGEKKKFREKAKNWL
jgi:hypothetical protein